MGDTFKRRLSMVMIIVLAVFVIYISLINPDSPPAPKPIVTEEDRRLQFERELKVKDAAELQKQACATAPWQDRCR